MICWLFLLSLTLAVFAHPLEQLNADSRCRFRFAPGRLDIRYDITFAAGATLTRLPKLDLNRDGRLDEQEEAAYLKTNADHFREHLHLKFDGRPLALTGGHSRLINGTDSNGLPQLSLEIELQAAINVTGDHRLEIDDQGFQGVSGWREIQVVADDGVGILAAPEPPQNAVEALQTQGEVKIHRGVTTWKPRSTAVKPKASEDRLLKLIGSKDTSFQTVLMTLAVAYVLGALHALQPGHGKTVVGAYLIGSRGTVGHALFLGFVVTFTHTFSVILLGVVTLFAFKSVVPEKIIPWLGFTSGMLVSLMGVLLIRYRDTIFAHGHSHDHGHEHGHSHLHDGHSELAHHDARPFAGTVSPELALGRERGDSAEGAVPQLEALPPAASLPPATHGHSHGHIPEKLTLAGLISLGVSGGMVPCPDALVVLLGAIALNKLALGLLVLLSFSTGLASVLMAIGVLMVKASHIFENRYPSQDRVRQITELSYLVIILMGLFLAYQSLRTGGIIGS